MTAIYTNDNKLMPVFICLASVSIFRQFYDSSAIKIGKEWEQETCLE